MKNPLTGHDPESVVDLIKMKAIHDGLLVNAFLVFRMNNELIGVAASFRDKAANTIFSVRNPDITFSILLHGSNSLIVWRGKPFEGLCKLIKTMKTSIGSP